MHIHCVLDVFTYQRIWFSWLEHTSPEGRFHVVPVYDSWQNVSLTTKTWHHSVRVAPEGARKVTHILWLASTNLIQKGLKAFTHSFYPPAGTVESEENTESIQLLIQSCKENFSTESSSCPVVPHLRPIITFILQSHFSKCAVIMFVQNHVRWYQYH